MKYVGVDLHKQVIVLCVMVQKGSRRDVVQRQRFACQNVAELKHFFQSLGEFQVVVEATASYEWFVELVEPLAERVLLAHPRKLRVIAESTQKTDRIDARVLAEFLALDMIPQAHRPTPRVRQHRALVRQRQFIQRRITSAKCKVRHVLARYNADVKHLFTEAGQTYLSAQQLLPSDRFVVDQLVEDLAHYAVQLAAADRRLQDFARTATVAEREARAVLASVPCVGAVTVDVVLAELGDVRRFKNAKQVAAYAGLAPTVRESANRRKEGGITKEGLGLLRWVLIQTAWRAVGKTRRWGLAYEKTAEPQREPAGDRGDRAAAPGSDVQPAAARRTLHLGDGNPGLAAATRSVITAGRPAQVENCGSDAHERPRLFGCGRLFAVEPREIEWGRSLDSNSWRRSS